MSGCMGNQVRTAVATKHSVVLTRIREWSCPRRFVTAGSFTQPGRTSAGQPVEAPLLEVALPEPLKSISVITVGSFSSTMEQVSAAGVSWSILFAPTKCGRRCPWGCRP